jgi:GNAT superfamily N-acetyltransferase
VLELRDVPEDRREARLALAVERVARLRARSRFLDPDEARDQIEQTAERTRDRAALLDVVDGDRVAGLVWLCREGDELVVYDVVADEPERVAELVPALVARARAEEARTVGVGAHPDEPSRWALATAAGFVPRATNMALTLDGEIADPGELALRPMTQGEFDEFLARMGDDYAHELVATGLTPEAAVERSRQQMAELIPDGLDSPGMVFFTARVGDRPVGRLWLSTQHDMAFVYDVEVREDERRRGYGAAIMNAGAIWSREQGHPVLGLNVFAHNPGARALYDRLGYRVTFDYRTLDVPDAD